MLAYRAFAMLLVVLVALAGCKKKPADGTANTPAILEITGPHRPAAVRTMTDTFDRMTEEIGQDKMPFHSLGNLAERMPKPATPGGIGLNATPQRAELDASFAKLWAAWETFPERMRQKVIRDQTALLMKQGMTPDKAQAQAEKQNQKLPPLKITAPNPDFRDKFFTQIEADVKDGEKDFWTQNGGLRVTGSVEYSESLRIHCNGGLTVGLRGRAGVLTLQANGELIADLVEMNAPVVEVMPNGPLFLRVGPSTNTVRVTGNAVGAVILIRGNTGLKVEGVEERSPRNVAVIAY